MKMNGIVILYSNPFIILILLFFLMGCASSIDETTELSELSDEEFAIMLNEENKETAVGLAWLTSKILKPRLTCTDNREQLTFTKGYWNKSLPKFFCERDSQRERVCTTSGYTIMRTRCGLGCLRGKCLEASPQRLLKISPECQEVVQGHNNLVENRTNIVFVGHHYDTIKEFRNIIKLFVDYDSGGHAIDIPQYEGNLDEGVLHGLFGVEIYKSNKEKFNIWYVSVLYNGTKGDTVCPTTATDLELFCPDLNRYTINLCNYHTQIAGIASLSNNEVGISTINEEGEFDEFSVSLINHELGGHALAGLADVAYPNLEFSSYPNCAATLDLARSWWKGMIGDGCGVNGVVDCREDCYSKGECSAGEYQTEVQFIAVQPEDCFMDGRLIGGCSLDLERRNIQPGVGEIRNKHISFKAMLKEECQESTDNCIYLNSTGLYCFDKYIPREDLCSSLINRGLYPSFPNHESVVGCRYKPHLVSIMKMAPAHRFGPVNEKEICLKLKRIVGNVSGYCTSYFGVS